MDVGLVAAFVGGMLALLSPCGALLLPAFFASNVGATPRLLVHGAAFYLGLLVTLVPLGLGLGALGELTMTHRDLVIRSVAVLLIVLGVMQSLGMGFDLTRLVPGANRPTSRTGITRTVLLGATGGVAGFCTGPILGAVLALAMTRQGMLSAGMLLTVYGAGMVVPLIVLAAGWDRISLRTRRALRGRGFTVLGRELHTTTLLSGLLMIVLGIVFEVTNGLVDAPEILSAATQTRLQAEIGRFSGPIFDVVAILAVASLVMLVWWRRQRPGPRRSGPGTSTGAIEAGERP